MPTSDAARSPFQWHASAWWGATLGATLWLFVLGVALAPAWPAVVSTLACASLVVGLALWLWRTRTRRRAYTATQLMILASGVAALASLGLIHALGAGPRLASLVRARSLGGWWVLAVYPLLLLVFAYRERSAQRRTELAAD